MQGPIGFDGTSLHKCIRPLASGPLLRPGLDEIRAPRSQINASGLLPAFLQGLTMRWSTVLSSLSRTSQLVAALLS